MAVNLKSSRVDELIAVTQRQPGREHHQRRLEEAPLLRDSAGTLQELLEVAPYCVVLESVEADLARRALTVVQRFGLGPCRPAQFRRLLRGRPRRT